MYSKIKDRGFSGGSDDDVGDSEGDGDIGVGGISCNVQGKENTHHSTTKIVPTLVLRDHTV